MAVNTTDWYKNWFGNEYLTVYAHRDSREAQQLFELVMKHVPLRPSDRVLDLCCGQGRHSLLFAENGFRVTGMDLSRTLLERAKYTGKDHSSAWFIQTDMRALPTGPAFDLILNLFTSFGYFDDDSENQLVFNEFNSALKPGAHFVFDYFNAGFVRRTLVPHQRDQVSGIEVEQNRTIENGRVQKKITLRKANSEDTYFESVKMYSRNEIEQMMTSAGLTPIHVFGDYDGSAWFEDAPRLIIIGQKR
jgi:SAM-dependent methyltransferase